MLCDTDDNLTVIAAVAAAAATAFACNAAELGKVAGRQLHGLKGGPRCAAKRLNVKTTLVPMESCLIVSRTSCHGASETLSAAGFLGPASLSMETWD